MNIHSLDEIRDFQRSEEQMEKKNISMFTDERWNDNADAVTYAGKLVHPDR